MKELFWEADDVPEVMKSTLLEWVNQNVIKALDHFWQNESPLCEISQNKSGKLMVKVHGPSRSTKADPAGRRTSYVATFDLLKLVQESLDGSDSQKTVDEFRKLAKRIDSLATKREQLIKQKDADALSTRARHG